MNELPTPRPQLLRHELDDQVLIYDPKDDRVHLLDLTTGRIFVLLERRSTRSEIVAELEGDTDSKEVLVDLALDELMKAGLLESPDVARQLSDVSRREMLRRLAMAGAAAALIPAIATLAAAPAYAQGSCLPQCAPCVRDSQCCTHCDANGKTRCGLVRDTCP